MKAGNKKLLTWLPRILVILFAVFVSLFALDVFSEEKGFLQTIIALLIHLIPTYIIVIILILSWRRVLIGAVIFPLLGISYLFMGWGRINWPAFALISGPLFIIGILYYLNWIYRKDSHSS
jgi:ABC-type molybdate transport system permease subunit